MPKQTRNVLFMLLFILLPAALFSQELSGTVLDSITQLPVAFAGVTVKETKRGGLTDIDGVFKLRNVGSNNTLLVTYTGYATKQVSLSKTNQPLVILLTRKTESLDEVVVKSDLNPAHRIIRLMQENKKDNDPARFSSYAYNAYTIAAVGLGPLMIRQIVTNRKINGNKKPKMESPLFSSKDTATDKFRSRHIFVAESYTERIFKRPNQVKETVLATKVSGIDNPIFAVTGARFQQFGFYMDYMTILNKSYTSPVINGSISLYKFSLRQVIPHEKDTTYVIGFAPQKGKNFLGLKGSISINSDGWAIENVTAEPADAKDMLITFRFLQKYEKTDNHWFPSQINTYIAQRDIVKDSVYFYTDTRSYMKNIVLNKYYPPSAFSDVALELAPGAGKKTEETWTTLRADSLQPKEKETYDMYDRLPPKRKRILNNYNNFLEAVGRQAIPWGVVDLPFKYFISGINRYEGVRLGLGIQTNRKLSNWFTAGVNGGYGFHDEAFKYGGNIGFIFNRRTNTKLTFSFKQDLLEPGVMPFFSENASIFTPRLFRNLYTSRLDSIREWKADFTTKIRPWFQADAWLQTDHRNPAGFDYQFDPLKNGQFINEYNNSELGIGLRYTRGETYANIGNSKVINTPPKTQVLFQASRGVRALFDGDLDYTKLALQVNHSFRTKYFGKTSFQVDLGQVWGNVPYAYLFAVKGSVNDDQAKRRGGFFINNTFQTVGIYEFTANRIASLFFQQNFGNLLFKPNNPMFRPEFVLVQNIGYGSIDNTAFHKGVILQAPEKGLFESGLLVKNMMRINAKFFYLGLGFGLFHRYGYYTLPENQKNWAFKVGLDISF